MKTLTNQKNTNIMKKFIIYCEDRGSFLKGSPNGVTRWDLNKYEAKEFDTKLGAEAEIKECQDFNFNNFKDLEVRTNQY